MRSLLGGLVIWVLFFNEIQSSDNPRRINLGKSASEHQDDRLDSSNTSRRRRQPGMAQLMKEHHARILNQREREKLLSPFPFAAHEAHLQLPNPPHRQELESQNPQPYSGGPVGQQSSQSYHRDQQAPHPVLNTSTDDDHSRSQPTCGQVEPEAHQFPFEDSADHLRRISLGKSASKQADDSLDVLATSRSRKPFRVQLHRSWSTDTDFGHSRSQSTFGQVEPEAFQFPTQDSHGHTSGWDIQNLKGLHGGSGSSFGQVHPDMLHYTTEGLHEQMLHNIPAFSDATVTHGSHNPNQEHPSGASSPSGLNAFQSSDEHNQNLQQPHRDSNPSALDPFECFDWVNQKQVDHHGLSGTSSIQDTNFTDLGAPGGFGTVDDQNFIFTDTAFQQHLAEANPSNSPPVGRLLQYRASQRRASRSRSHSGSGSGSKSKSKSHRPK